MANLKVGFIGTGRISDLHALEYLANPRAEIVERERNARWVQDLVEQEAK